MAHFKRLAVKISCAFLAASCGYDVSESKGKQSGPALTPAQNSTAQTAAFY